MTCCTVCTRTITQCKTNSQSRHKGENHSGQASLLRRISLSFGLSLSLYVLSHSLSVFICLSCSLFLFVPHFVSITRSLCPTHFIPPLSFCFSLFLSVAHLLDGRFLPIYGPYAGPNSTPAEGTYVGYEVARPARR